ncbi:MAG: Thiosulfate sulfurtransferase PspE [Dehalococcoidia bacterium]|nr:Thiosulfate sulfurtransferase PspE [Bacillota bacterium]
MQHQECDIIWIKVVAVRILPAVVMLFSGCVERDRKTATFTNISPQEARSRLEQESGIILLDVRTPAEYLERHIPGSLLIPVDCLEQDALSLLPDRSATVFIYCRSGRRSVTAANILLELRYTSVYNLGGIIDWPFETTGGTVK